jgi:hypothetical protein
MWLDKKLLIWFNSKLRIPTFAKSNPSFSNKGAEAVYDCGGAAIQCRFRSTPVCL